MITTRFKTLFLIEIYIIVQKCLPATSCFDENQDAAAVCGIPSLPNFVNRIVGGTKVLRGQFPWIAAYYNIIEGGKEEFLCGATLISSKSF